MDAKDFRRIALSLEGAEEGSHLGAVDFRVGREDFCHAGARKARLREFDADAGATGGIRGGIARSISARSWWMGKAWSDAHRAGDGERRCAGRGVADGVEAASGEEGEIREEEQCAGKGDARIKSARQEVMMRECGFDPS
jgi:hypothetical protein